MILARIYRFFFTLFHHHKWKGSFQWKMPIECWPLWNGLGAFPPPYTHDLWVCTTTGGSQFFRLLTKSIIRKYCICACSILFVWHNRSLIITVAIHLFFCKSVNSIRRDGVSIFISFFIFFFFHQKSPEETHSHCICTIRAQRHTG